jgi:hypothetical protein
MCLARVQSRKYIVLPDEATLAHTALSHSLVHFP